MESIIKKAIEGGWRSDLEITTIREHKGTHLISFLHDENGQVMPDISPQEIVCDPLFWQALGKACGWEIHHEDGCFSFFEGGKCDCSFTEDGWLVKAKRFHEINLTEGWEKAVEYLKSITN